MLAPENAPLTSLKRQLSYTSHGRIILILQTIILILQTQRVRQYALPLCPRDGGGGAFKHPQ